MKFLKSLESKRLPQYEPSRAPGAARGHKLAVFTPQLSLRLEGVYISAQL